MNAKDKAKELVLKFYSVQTDAYDYGINWIMAKQCAIIAVDEIIDLLTNDVNPIINYWFEVKKEIEKL